MARAFGSVAPELVDRGVKGRCEVQVRDETPQREFALARYFAGGAFESGHRVLDGAGHVELGPVRDIPQCLSDFVGSGGVPSVSQDFVGLSGRFGEGVGAAIDDLAVGHLPTDTLVKKDVVELLLEGSIGRTGWLRSSAWIWLFSSTQSTSARSGGEK